MWQWLLDNTERVYYGVGIAAASACIVALVGGSRIWQWLLDNKEWIFGGVGVAVAAAIVGWLVRLFRVGHGAAIASNKEVSQKQQRSPGSTQVSVVYSKNVVVQTQGSEAATVQPVAEKKYLERPTPLEIHDEISKRPPLQQEEAGGYYVGLAVRWSLVFSSAWQDREGCVHVTLRDPKKITVGVTCSVDLAQYPEMKIASEGVPVCVTGEIERAERHYIKLRDARLEFE